MKITLAIAFVATALASALPAVASDKPYYDHSMQALGSSELGMPPVRRGATNRITCEPTVFADPRMACE